METFALFMLALRLLLLQCLEQLAICVGIEHIRMNITLATDSRGIAEMQRGLFDGFRNVLLRLRLRPGFPQLLEHLRGNNSTRPGAEIFRREILSRNLSQVFIYIR